jgi:hypothetical protein
MRNYTFDTWRIAFCNIQPTVEAGNAAFETAVQGALGSAYYNQEVIGAYYDYLCRGEPVLTQEEFATCVHNAQALAWPVDYILEKATVYKSKRLV